LKHIQHYDKDQLVMRDNKVCSGNGYSNQYRVIGRGGGLARNSLLVQNGTFDYK
jgi:hypothetical protein